MVFSGTIVTVSNLFVNLPVRRNLYHKNATRKKDDLRKVEQLCLSYALVRPRLRVTLIHDGVVVFRKAECKDMKAGIVAVLSQSTAQHLQLIEGEDFLTLLFVRVAFNCTLISL